MPFISRGQRTVSRHTLPTGLRSMRRTATSAAVLIIVVGLAYGLGRKHGRLIREATHPPAFTQSPNVPGPPAPGAIGRRDFKIWKNSRRRTAAFTKRHLGGSAPPLAWRTDSPPYALFFPAVRWKVRASGRATSSPRFGRRMEPARASTVCRWNLRSDLFEASPGQNWSCAFCGATSIPAKSKRCACHCAGPSFTSTSHPRRGGTEQAAGNAVRGRC